MARSELTDSASGSVPAPELGASTMVMFLFLVVALAVVVAAVTLAVVGGGKEGDGPLPDAAPERLRDPLPDDRPVGREDVESLRFPLAVRGYRMSDVDDALGRLGAELAERDARIAGLESALAGARAAAPRPTLDKSRHPEDQQ